MIESEGHLMNLLLAAVLLLQDKSAEETLKRIQEGIEKAKTVSVSIRYTTYDKTGEKEKRMEGSIDLLLKDANRINIGATANRQGEQRKFSLISDGSKTAAMADGEVEQAVSPKKLKENIAIALARVGGGATTVLARRLTANDQNELPDFGKALSLSEIKGEADDGDYKTISYRVIGTDLHLSMEVKAWYDAKTNMMVKRVFKRTDAPGQSVITETYSGFTLNADIPDEKFKLPEEKK